MTWSIVITWIVEWDFRIVKNTLCSPPTLFHSYLFLARIKLFWKHIWVRQRFSMREGYFNIWRGYTNFALRSRPVLNSASVSEKSAYWGEKLKIAIFMYSHTCHIFYQQSLDCNWLCPRLIKSSHWPIEYACLCRPMGMGEPEETR